MTPAKFRLTATGALAASLLATTALADSNLEFVQWWEPELPAGALRGIMDDFEAANPGITVTLVSGPYSSTKDQIVVGGGFPYGVGESIPGADPLGGGMGRDSKHSQSCCLMNLSNRPSALGRINCTKPKEHLGRCRNELRDLGR